MNADASVIASLSACGVFLGILALLMVVSVPEALLDPAKEIIWGLRCLWGPANKK